MSRHPPACPAHRSPCATPHTAADSRLRLDAAVRLKDGNSINEGRVEVLHAGQWWPLCADRFGPRAAAIVCRQVGWIGGPATLRDADTFGGSSPTVAWLNYYDDSYGEDLSALHEAQGGNGLAFGESTCSAGMSAVTCSDVTGEPSTYWACILLNIVCQLLWCSHSKH